MRLIHENTQMNDCERFKENGWCNCHNSFNVRIGVTEGKGIIYKDLNGNYNVVGNVINLASRIMSFGDDNHILLNSDAYTNIIDMTNDVNFEDCFVFYPHIKIKHGFFVDIYQYSPNNDYINSSTPKKIKAQNTMKQMRESMNSLMPGYLPIDDDLDEGASTDKMLKMVDLMKQAVEERKHLNDD